MANEFKIKNGLVSDGNIVVTGSITATGGINISGSIASAETASFAPSYTLSSSFNSYTSSASSSVGSLSSSVATTTSGLGGRITTIEGNYATTGSNIFLGSQVITGSICSNGNIVTTGQIVAQTINVQQVTSSIVYSCGSNIFGNSVSNTQQFTGSILATGSLTLTGPMIGSSTVCGVMGNFSCVGIGTSSPSTPLQILRDTTGNGTNIEESNMAITVVSATGQSKTSIGASNAGNYGYIQVMQDGTCWSNRNLTLQPRGGNVGIGTYTPDRLLTINGDSTLLGNNYLSTSKFLQWEGGAYWTTRVTSTGNQFEIYRGDTGASPLVISNCNKIGIGATSPRWLLEICANNACGAAGQYPAISINNVCSNGYSAYYFYKGADQVGGMEMSNGTGHLLINSPTTFAVQTSGNNKLLISGANACFGVDANFCGSTYGIMGLGAKVHEGTYFVYTGPSCVLTLPINYSSASSIYLFGSLFGNDSMHYAHMMYYYRNDFAGFQGAVINQMSCYNVSTAGQRYTFSVVDPGGLGKSGCQLQINITCAAGPGVGSGSYCTKFKIVVYNIY